MKKLIHLLFILLLLGTAQKMAAQAVLGLSSNLQCGTYTYCVDVKMSATTGNFQLGTSSILLKYNPTALVFQNYTPLAFDSTACAGAWSPHQIDVDEAKGEWSLTMKVLNPSSPCVVVDTAAQIIGTICFAIQQQGASPELGFVSNFTHLNKNTPDNGTLAIAISSFDSITTTGELACDCPGIGAPCNDNNVFTTNDQFDANCDCAGETLDADADGIADGVDPCRDVQYEAEDAYYIGGFVATNHIQFFGSGFVDYNGWQGDTLEFTITAVDTGMHDLAIRYSNGSTYDRRLKVTVDGIVTHSNMFFPPTNSSWEEWDTVLFSHYFTIGTHSVLFTSNPNNEPNIDRLTLSYCTGCATAGQWCNDGDSCTILDITDVNCNCAGVLLDADEDGVCDQADICADADDNIDTDGDGIPDGCDNCDNTLVGTACDDGNPCTTNDVFDGNCNCSGTPTGIDTDNDGVCDAFDVCAGGDDNVDEDADGIPDFCDVCDNRNVGQPCNDGNPCTVLDVYDAACNCGGIPIYVDISAAVHDVSCFGLDNGIVDLSVAGSFGDLLYEWNTGDSISDLYNLSPGTYEVTVTDFRTCKDSATFVIVQPDTLVVNYSIVAAADSNGSIDLTVAGGILPYTYTWAIGDTTEDLTNLIADTYHVLVTDANNCVQNVAVDVYPDDMCVDLILQAEDGILHLMGKDIWNERLALGDGFIYFKDDTTEKATYYFDVPADGFYTIGFRYADQWATRTAKILVDNIVEFSAFEFPRTYEWLKWEKAEFVQYLTAGTHELILAHANHNWGPWIDFISVCDQVVVPISLEAAITNNTCYGAAEGILTVLATGGTRHYNYLWSTGDTTTTIDSLLAGDYFITVTDEVGQITIDTFTVGQPTEIAPVFSVRDAKCKGDANGRADVNVTGGTQWYNYLWSNGQTWKSTYNVIAGTYTLTVTDANGCVKISDVVIGEPDTLAAVFNNTVSIGNNGTIDMTVLGGNPPYTYFWKDSTATEDRTGLAVGNYRITVTDTLNCKLKTSTDVYPAGLCLDTIMQAEEGFYQNISYNIWYADSTTGRGYIHFSADTAGFATYTFDVANAGYYALGFRFSNQYNTPRNLTIEIDNAIEYTDFAFPPTSNWKNYEFIDFTKYLTAGTHVLKLKHRHDWSPRIDFITVCDIALEGSVSQANVSCNGDSTGWASASVSGGRTPYQYLWNTGDTTTTISNLPVGTYTVMVTDTLNQVFLDTVEIQQPMPVLPLIVGTDVSCAASADGQAVVSASGGVGNYTYLWGNSSTSATIANLDTGVYTVIATDAAGCIGTTNITINEPQPLIANINTSLAVDCFGNNTGSATVTALGGNGNYNYLWSNADTLATANALYAGTYTVTVADAKGCFDTATVTITEPSALVLSLANTQNVSCFSQHTGSIFTNTTGGTSGYNYLWNNGLTNADLQNVSAGTYTLTVTDANNCSATLIANIAEPTPLNLQLATTNIDCNGNANGSVAASVTGGTGSYIYQWSNTATTATLDSLGVGTYVVTIIDSLGCVASDSVAITEPSTLTSTATVSPSTGSDGAINVTGLGGTSNYTFLWSDAATTANRTGLLVGNYSVTITDANGCTTSETFSVYDANTCLDDLYPAEMATATGAMLIFNNNSGALGTGYADFGTDTTELLSFTVSPTIDTIYEIGIRYAQGGMAQPLEISIDGNVIYSSLVFSNTLNWNTWNYMTFKQPLTAGTHNIQLRNSGGNGPNIDYLSLCVTAPDTVSPVFNVIKNRQTPPTLYPYPNPATTDLRLEMTLANAPEGILTILDVNGKQVFQTVIKNTGQAMIQEKINIENYAPGVYFVQLQTALGRVVKKITVIR